MRLIPPDYDWIVYRKSESYSDQVNSNPIQGTLLAYAEYSGHLTKTFPVARAIALPSVIGLCGTGGARPLCNPLRFLSDPN